LPPSLRELAPRYRPGDTLKGWLCGIALKKARRLNDSRTSRRGLLARFFRPRTQVPAPEAASDVERVLAQLPEPMREVVVLSLIEELAAEDVAKALGISVNTVWTRLHRARAKVRELLDAEERP
jgi:RNA polymerase sigma-70 factor, ECF subfamily